jgi:hypothetical protein
MQARMIESGVKPVKEKAFRNLYTNHTDSLTRGEVKANLQIAYVWN